MLTAILFVIMLLVLIIPHEAGHLIMAKICGVYVEEFSVGMGPKLVGKKLGETEYSLRLLPLGGYCKMRSGLEEDAKEGDPRAFRNKTDLQKIAIMCAGIVMNVFLAWVILTGMLAVNGVAVNKLSDVTKGGPAYEAGVRTGDRITAVNGHECDFWSDTIVELSKMEKDEIIELEVSRDGSHKTFYMTPEYDEASDRMIVGIVSGVSREPITVMRAGLRSTVEMNSQILGALRDVIRGTAPEGSIGGPVKVVQVVNQTTSFGARYYLMILAMISLNLAIFNLLPIPSLDGARILFVVVRRLSGGRITEDMEAYVNVLGMMLLLGIFVLITINDITSLF